MYFLKAKPMWAKNEAKTMNYHLVLRASVEEIKNTVIYVTAAYTYRLSVNGEFVFYGPARAAEGYSRVDEISLDRFSGEPAEIVIEVSGYNCRSYVCTKQDSFIIAELRRGNDVVLTTNDFDAFYNVNAVREVLRYCGQRHFTEVYDYTKPLFDDENRVELVESNSKIEFLNRHVEYPEFNIAHAAKCSLGDFILKTEYPADYCFAIYHGKNDWGSFNPEKIKYSPFAYVSGCEFKKVNRQNTVLLAGEYMLFDLEKIYSGFINVDFLAEENSDVIIAYSEMCKGDVFEYTTCSCRNAIELILQKGNKKFASFEPYTARFVAILVKSGKVDINGFYIRSYEHSLAGVKTYSGNDEELSRIYNAAIRSFCHNAVDIYTDCPSRERAGWLCDSYFSGKAEYELFGEHRVEDNFLENYRLFKGNERLPEGAVPMCYPADVNLLEDGGFIPQWNLWYILEVCEYLTTRNKKIDKEKFRNSVLGILNFFKNYENSDGMLESLPSWNFVEWSTANDWTWHVNYPTNFLYSEALIRVGELFEIAELVDKAIKIREKTIGMSFNGEIFCDHAIRNAQGILENQPHISAAAQYYAALFGGIDINDKKFEKLLKHIRGNFEHLDKSQIEFVPVNAFIGFYLRMEFFMRNGEKDLLKQDIKDFFAKNVVLTDTLWEHKYLSGSLDHGFSSYVVLAINYVTD